MNGKDFEKIEEMLKRHLGILSEDFQHKLDLVVEGHQGLSGKIDGLETRMDRLETKMNRVEAKVDAVATDLAEHRRDTQAHRAAYRVREE